MGYPLQSPSQQSGGPSEDLIQARPLLVSALHQMLAQQASHAFAGPIPVAVIPHGLVQAVCRHRLALVLAPAVEILPWPPEVLAALKQEVRHQQRAALALIAGTLEVYSALGRSDLRVLLVKGPALALQTTGQPWSRGGGDIDVLVAPSELPKAVAVLEDLGFQRPPGQFPRELSSFWGRYSRWVSHELPLERGGRWIDLHWALSSVRAPLPAFDILWQARQEMHLNNQSVATLGLEHAFRHSCLHAASDRWMELRQLVDLTLLARQLPAKTGSHLGKIRSVRLSCAAAYDATGCPELLHFTDPQRPDCRRAIALAQWTQVRPPRAGADGAWHPGHWLRTVLHRASLSPSPLDWLRVVARFSLLPAAFNDPLTGRDLGLVAMLQARRRRLRQRLGERFSSIQEPP